MAAKVQRFYVPTPEDMEQSINSYIIQGFVVVNKTSTSASLMKKKEFSTLWLVIGFLLCVLPLLVYLIVYATQSDQFVEIIVNPEEGL